MVTQTEIALINALVKMALWIGVIIGILAMSISYYIWEKLQQKKILNIMKSKDDRDVLSAFWLMKGSKK